MSIKKVHDLYKKYHSNRVIQWEDISGKIHLTKQSAQIASFLIIVKGRFLTGFPVVINHFWFHAITIYPFIFLRKDYVKGEVVNHEMIHIKQQLEMAIIFAYVWYLLEFIFRLFQYKFNIHNAYLNISFEKEARINQRKINYVIKRKHYSFLKYL